MSTTKMLCEIDLNTGVFVAVRYAVNKDRDTGEWLYPLNYFDIAPPENREGYVAILSKDLKSWSYSKDNSGVWFDTATRKTVTVDNPIAEVPDTYIRQILTKYEIYNKTTKEITFDLALYKTDKALELSQSFEDAFASASFMSTTIGIMVDCRRAGIKNDLQNVQGLIDDFDSLTTQEKYYIGLSEVTTFALTLEQFQQLKLEMIRHGKSLYQKKWLLLSEVEAAATKEQIDLITW